MSYRRFRILNTVYRGHVINNGDSLARALKIIIHSNYVHTRAHPQRMHRPMELDLEEIDMSEVPIYPARGTGFGPDDFHVGQRVLVWQARTWWHGKIIYKARSGLLTVRFVGAGVGTSGILAEHVKPAPDVE